MTTVNWTVVFKTREGHPEPEVTITNTGDYVLGFMASVVPGGWEVKSVNIDHSAHVSKPGTRVRVSDDFGNSYGAAHRAYRGQVGTVIEPRPHSDYINVRFEGDLGDGLFTEDELTVADNDENGALA